MSRIISTNLKKVAWLVAVLGSLSASRFAKAGQKTSQNLDVSVIVEPVCNVAVQPGSLVAQLDAGCPSSATQKVVRDIVLAPPSADPTSVQVSEQLIVSVNF